MKVPSSARARPAGTQIADALRSTYDPVLRSARRLVKRMLWPLVITRGPARSRRVALTFDDGPHPVYTPAVLAVLAKHRVRATFFLIGENVEKHPQLVDAIVRGGHEIGNHSYSHRNVEMLGFAELRREILVAHDLLSRPQWAAAYRRLYRSPKGKITFALMLVLIRHSITDILWSRDPEDFRAEDANVIDARFASLAITDGDIVLLHDGSGPTVRSLPKLLSRIEVSGLQPVTITELLRPGPIW